MNQYGYSPERAREVFYFPDWFEWRERIPADYGVPEHPYMPGYILTDYERSPEFLEATLF